MAKQETAPVDGTTAEGSAESAKAARKKRSASKFQLVRELPKEDGKGSRFEVVSSGATVNQLKADAEKMDDGRYGVINVRCVFEVLTATTKTVKKVK